MPEQSPPLTIGALIFDGVEPLEDDPFAGQIDVAMPYLYPRAGGAFNCTYSSRPYHLWNVFGLDLDYECRAGSP